MTSGEYRAAIKRLGLEWGSNEAAKMLGIGKEACKRYASGMPIPKEIATALELLVHKSQLSDDRKILNRVK